MMTPLGPNEMLKPLTSLRFPAAVLIFLVHYPSTKPWADALSFGYAGVGFFFLLSGFILSYTYGPRFLGGMTWARLREFYVARLARVYPILFVTSIGALGVRISLGGHSWTGQSLSTHTLAIVAELALLQSWTLYEPVLLGLNGPAWSISTEAFFYLLFPLIVSPLIKIRLRTQAGALVVLWALLTAFLMTQKADPYQWMLYSFPPSRVPDFAVGVALGCIFLRKRLVLPEFLATGYEVLALSCAAMAIVASFLIPYSLRFSSYLMPFWAFLIIVFASRQGVLSRVLSTKVFVKLGESSFAFYLIHLSIIDACTGMLPGISPAVGFAITFGLSLSAAVMLFKFVETPLRRRIILALGPKYKAVVPTKLLERAARS